MTTVHKVTRSSRLPSRAIQLTKKIRPSSNWIALQKSLVRHGHAHPYKRHKIDRSGLSVSISDRTVAYANISPLPPKRFLSDNRNQDVDLESAEVKNGESIATLRKMVLGQVEYKDGHQTTPGRYLALDCEMVGVGIDGEESSLARVSIVNYTGAIILDVFVRQREKVVDYRTKWSGVRSTDLGGSAKHFEEVQRTVAGLIKDRVLVGHAVYNDLKALLLSQPSSQIRDTQSLAYKYRVTKSRYPALRVLVKQELGIIIQGGEHSSVTDARATMALFRLHKKQWESGFRPLRPPAHSQTENKVDDLAGKAAALRQPSPSSQPSLKRGQKRGHPGALKLDDGGAHKVAKVSSQSSQSRVRSPSPSVASGSSTQRASTLPKHHQQKSKTRPLVGSTHQKGISSGISTVTRRASGSKEVRRKGAQGSVVGNSSKGGKQRDKAGEKWWKSLGGSKKGSAKL